MTPMGKEARGPYAVSIKAARVVGGGHGPVLEGLHPWPSLQAPGPSSFGFLTEDRVNEVAQNQLHEFEHNLGTSCWLRGRGWLLSPVNVSGSRLGFLNEYDAKGRAKFADLTLHDDFSSLEVPLRLN